MVKKKYQNNLFIKVNQSPIKIIIIIFILLIIIYFISQYKNTQCKNTQCNTIKKYNIENFYTLFKPYYDETITRSFAKPTGYYFKPLKFGVRDLDNDHLNNMYINKLVKILIGYSNIGDVIVIKYNKSEDILKDVNHKKIDIGLVPSPILSNAITGSYNFKNNVQSNIQFITNYSNFFIYLITRRNSNINKPSDISGKKVAIGRKNSTTWIVSNDIIETLLLENIAPPQKLTIEAYEAYEKLLKGEIDAFLYTGIYPSTWINNLINNSNEIKIVPFDNFDNNIFLTKYPYYRKNIIDLTLLPQIYLPINIGNTHYDRYFPNITMYRFHNSIICNPDVSKRITYQIVKTVFESHQLFRKDKLLKTIFSEPLDNSFNFSDLVTNIGAKQYYKDYGYKTFVADEGCKNFVGKLPCTKQTLQKHGLLLDYY